MTQRELVLTKEYLNETFSYVDGELFWKARPVHHFKTEWAQKVFNSRQANTKAGTVLHGYTQVGFAFGKLAAHRIIFVMHHGYAPEEVDHIDGNPSNNLLSNLRAVTHGQNMINAKTSARNTSGYKGVYWHKTTNKWSASIRHNCKLKHLGLFVDIEDARAARKLAESQFHGEFANER